MVGILHEAVEYRHDFVARRGRYTQHDFGAAGRGVIVQLARVGEYAERHDVRGGEVATARLVRRTEITERSAQPRAADGDPAVAVLGNVREHLGTGCTAQKRAHPWLLHRLGPLKARCEVDEFAVELCDLL